MVCVLVYLGFTGEARNGHAGASGVESWKKVISGVEVGDLIVKAVSMASLNVQDLLHLG